MTRTGHGRTGRHRLLELGAIRDVPQRAWDALVGDDSPFLEWAWLSSLEDSGAASMSSGWTPRHLTLWRDDELVAACPLYEKAHSRGEFVFDQGWASAAMRAGIPYYPKLVAGVPVTPITGSRILARPGVRAEAVAAFAGVLEDRCTAGEFSSVHVNFCRGAEVAELRARGWFHRTGLQYHWTNAGFTSFDDYLGSLRSTRRNQVRRERRDVVAAGVEVRVHRGRDIPDELFPQMYELYARTVDALPWGQRYLNPRFFELVRERFLDRLSFVVARQGGRVIAGTFNVESADTFYGRYWGARRGVRYLHFEVCYYAGIEHCIARGLKRFEPGAGGEFKHLRGFEAVQTDSMHWLAHPRLAAAVEDYLGEERQVVADEIEWYGTRTALRRDRERSGA
jgi:predicted N-acyltransferase